MDSKEIRDVIHGVLEAAESTVDHDGPLAGRVERILSFIDAGVYTRMDGLVIAMVDGSEFQLTVTRTRYAPTAR